jgi:phage shock protein A
MGILSRFINVVRSNLSSALDKAEDPEKMLNQMVTDMESQKRQTKTQVAHVLAEQKKLERALTKERQEVQKWEQKAILAVQNEKDALAKEALLRKKEHATRAAEFEEQLAIHTKNTETLRQSYQQLEDKIEEIKRKKGLLIAKQKTAEAQKNMVSTMEGMDGKGAIETIERIEQKVEDMQDRSEAYLELSQEQGNDSLEKQFATLEGGTSNVDMELLELKKRALLEHKDDSSN